MSWRSGVDELSGAPMEANANPFGLRILPQGETLPEGLVYVAVGDDLEFHIVPENKSGIHPTEFRVLVLPDKVEEKTKGGIIIPDEKKERDQYAVMEATIIECSPLAFTYEQNWPDTASKPKAGDRVVIAKYSGAIIKGRDNVEYKLIADKDIAAVLE